MKSKFLIIGLLSAMGLLVHASNGDTKKKGKSVQKTVSESQDIEWISIEEAAKRTQTVPKKVLVDVYTNWCGWCKHMDATTFHNPVIVDYVKKNYYAVKFNAETHDSIRFHDKTFGFKPEYKANELAVTLMNGSMSYPTIVYLDEQLNLLTPVPGFQNAKTEEMILKYFGDNTHKTVKWEDYTKSFKGEVKDAPETRPVMPGH